MYQSIMKQLFVLLFVVLAGHLAAQDEVLFNVGKAAVTRSEFEYIYKKTNGDKADFSKSSLNEYLDLYARFKLKVQKALDMRLDTIPELKRELNDYRRQLTNSYLVDKEVTERLVKELYERTKTEIDVAHIMVACKPDASPADTLAAYNKIMEARRRVSNEPWAAVAINMSDDNGTKQNGGRIGFLAAPLPNGFYNLERLVYNTEPGAIAGPVRTNAGYHVIKVFDTRPAKGEIEVSHILVRTGERHTSEVAKRIIDSAYQMLAAGTAWNEVVRKYSEDGMTVLKDGYIGFFGINKYDRNFETAAFSIPGDNKYCAPFESPAGWHIIKRISLRTPGSYDIERKRLAPKVQRDGRFELARQSLVSRIQNEAGFKLNEALFKSYTDTLGKQFLSYSWKPNETGYAALMGLPPFSSQPVSTPPAPAKTTSGKGGKTKPAPPAPAVPQVTVKDNGLPRHVLFRLANMDYTLADYENYCQKNSRDRLSAGTDVSVVTVANKLLTGFISETSLKYEETQLPVKNNDYKNLMREYEEGILLFEATKQQVWDKAPQDTVGLKQFHEKHRNNYMWGNRAQVIKYSVIGTGGKQVKKIVKALGTMSVDQIRKKYTADGKNQVKIEESYVEETKDPKLSKLQEGLTWSAGSITPPTTDTTTNTTVVYKVEKLVGPMPKSLNEARGYIIADYQDELEKQWVESLRKEYPIKINQDVLAKMTKKP